MSWLQRAFGVVTHAPCWQRVTYAWFVGVQGIAEHRASNARST
jgi:hypothetical protein